MLWRELVMQMPEMADAQSRHLENEDRISVDNATRRAAANIGGHVADANVFYLEIVFRRAACGIPSTQDMFDVGIGRVGMVRGVCLVHRHHVWQHASRPAGIVGGDLEAPRAFNQKCGMADEGELNLIGRKSRRREQNGPRLRWSFGHGEAIVASGGAHESEGKK